MRWDNPRIWLWIAAGIVMVNGFFPTVWILLTSFKTEGELTRIPITWLPENPTLQNYVQIFTNTPITRYFLSLIHI